MDLPAGSTRRYAARDYTYIPELGAWFALCQWEGRPCLESAPADAATAEPVWGSLCDVTNVDDDQRTVDLINGALGSSFTLAHFPGR
jgi:hypothetical protein